MSSHILQGQEEKDTIAATDEIEHVIKIYLFSSKESENNVCPNPEPEYCAD